MVERMTFLADQPELVALANLAGVAPSRVAAAFNNPVALFSHLSLDEIQRLHRACERLGSLTAALAVGLESWSAAAREVLQAADNG
jgi:hypothetical protein